MIVPALETLLRSELERLVIHEWNPLDLEQPTSEYEAVMEDVFTACIHAPHGGEIERALERLESQLTGRSGLELTRAARYLRRHAVGDRFMIAKGLWVEWSTVATDAGFGIWRPMRAVARDSASDALDDVTNETLRLVRPLLANQLLMLADLAPGGALVPRLGHPDTLLATVRSDILRLQRFPRFGEVVILAGPTAANHRWDLPVCGRLENALEERGWLRYWEYATRFDDFDLRWLADDFAEGLGSNVDPVVRAGVLQLLAVAMEEGTLCPAGWDGMSWGGSVADRLDRIATAWPDGDLADSEPQVTIQACPN